MRWTTCPTSAKRGYLTETDALRALRRTQGAARRARQAGRLGPVPRCEKRAYECACGRWHLTSSDLRDPVDVSDRDVAQ